MARPLPMRPGGEIDLKLGIKSAFPHIRASLALVCLLWLAGGKKAAADFSRQEGEKIVPSDACAVELTALLEPLYGPAAGVSSAQFLQKIAENQLFKAQMESLIVAFELIWRVARVSFAEDRPNNAERSGGRRFAKRLAFTANMDLLGLIMEDEPQSFLAVLLHWATGIYVPFPAQYEDRLTRLFTLFSQHAVYRLRVQEGEDIRFQQAGIDRLLSDGASSVDFSDYKEAMGPLRILKSALSDGLNAFLSIGEGGEAVLRAGIDREAFCAYTGREETALALASTKVTLNLIEREPEPARPAGMPPRTGFARNRIVFGAPGTGKSHLLEEDRKRTDKTGARLFPDALFERVTFHPNYSYAQFVGGYRPKPKPTGDPLRPEYLSYGFVPGPFLRALIKAHQHPSENCLLIVEEINRAPAAAVFGDVFQLLDRGRDGTSSYAVSVSEELADYLRQAAPSLLGTDGLLSLPGNLYLWATMNSADQGVQPLDTAFKRRWAFEYLPLNHNEHLLDPVTVTLKYGVRVRWNDLRRAINQNLSDGMGGITEDKMIGPYFLSGEDFAEERFQQVFQSKLIMYLYEDVLKRRRGSFFIPSAETFSELLEAYNRGERIFSFPIPGEQPAGEDAL